MKSTRCGLWVFAGAPVVRQAAGLKRGSLVVAIASLVGCAADTTDPKGGAGWPPARAAGADSVIAVVDGQPITASDVKRQAAAAGSDAAHALGALVDAEVLAAEAARRGHTDDRDVRTARDQEMVRLFLVESFEKKVSPASIPENDMRRAWLRYQARFDHTEFRMIRHILAATTASDPKVWRDEVRRRADEVARAARAVSNEEEFAALAGKFSDGHLTLRSEEVPTAKRGWTEQPFADAAWALEKPGSTSDVVETRYGFHVLYYARYVAEERLTFDQAREQLRASIWVEWRKREFGRWVQDFMAKHAIEQHPERLAEDPLAADVDTDPTGALPAAPAP